MAKLMRFRPNLGPELDRVGSTKISMDFDRILSGINSLGAGASQCRAGRSGRSQRVRTGRKGHADARCSQYGLGAV